MEFADLRARNDLQLLREVHERLMQPTILLVEERQSLETWVRRLAPNPPPAPEPYLTALVAGLALDEPARRRLAGYAFLEWYRDSRTLLLSYLGVDAAFRRRGLARELLTRGTAMANAAAESREGAPSLATAGSIRAAFAEIHVPGQIDAKHEPMQTLARVRSFASLGAAVVPIRYIQPALEVGQDFGRGLMLLALAPGPESQPPKRLSKQVLIDFLDEYYRSCGFDRPFEVEEFRSVMASIDAAASGSPDFALPADCASAIRVVTIDP